MTLLSHDRYCSEIVSQTRLLVDRIGDADLAAPVPSCPGWDVSRLLHHVGDVQRFAETVVRTRATGPVPVEHSHGLPADAQASADPAVLGPWLATGAGQLAATLREAGPETAVWTAFPGGTAGFYARRFTHETAVHRADAALALGAPYTLDQDVAADAIDEWLELGTQSAKARPELRELLGPGRTLHLHATDTSPQLDAEWVIDLTGDVATWHRAHQKSAVAVRAPLTDLLLIIYKRRPPAGDAIQVFGDQDLLSFWLDRVSFG
jgi:uncharacterized protein (TIGR03083 family)